MQVSALLLTAALGRAQPVYHHYAFDDTALENHGEVLDQAIGLGADIRKSAYRSCIRKVGLIRPPFLSEQTAAQAAALPKILDLRACWS
jgi:hypothetical protein